MLLAHCSNGSSGPMGVVSAVKLVYRWTQKRSLQAHVRQNRKYHRFAFCYSAEISLVSKEVCCYIRVYHTETLLAWLLGSKNARKNAIPKKTQDCTIMCPQAL